MEYEYKVIIQYDVVKGLLPIFSYVDGHNQFSVSEWPDIRSDLREAVLKDIPEEYEIYLHSDRFGERFEYTIGTVIIDDDGNLIEKKYDASIESLKEAFDEMD